MTKTRQLCRGTEHGEEDLHNWICFDVCIWLLSALDQAYSTFSWHADERPTERFPFANR